MNWIQLLLSAFSNLGLLFYFGVLKLTHLRCGNRFDILIKSYPILGAGPINILQQTFYATQISKHSDWLKSL